MTDTPRTGVALVIRSRKTKSVVDRVELASLEDEYVESVELSLLRRMNLETYYVDDSEVVAYLLRLAGGPTNP